MSYTATSLTIFEEAIAAHAAITTALAAQTELLAAIAETMSRSLRSGGTVFWCGNGGSAADAQHLAAELMGRFRRERAALSSIALTTDTSILTAIGNDYGFEHVFRRQLEALCKPGDVVVGISTSGNSRNVILALSEARKRGATCVALTGQSGGAMDELADYIIRIGSADTARIQEAHILCGHMLCDWVELHQTGSHGYPEV